eukprot:gene621-5763_t
MTTRPRHSDAGHEPARQRGGALDPASEPAARRGLTVSSAVVA